MSLTAVYHRIHLRYICNSLEYKSMSSYTHLEWKQTCVHWVPETITFNNKSLVRSFCRILTVFFFLGTYWGFWKMYSFLGMSFSYQSHNRDIYLHTWDVFIEFCLASWLAFVASVVWVIRFSFCFKGDITKSLSSQLAVSLLIYIAKISWQNQESWSFGSHFIPI